MKCPKCGNDLTNATYGQAVCMPKGWLPSDQYRETELNKPVHVFNQEWVAGYWDGWNAAQAMKEATEPTHRHGFDFMPKPATVEEIQDALDDTTLFDAAQATKEDKSRDDICKYCDDFVTGCRAICPHIKDTKTGTTDENQE